MLITKVLQDALVKLQEFKDDFQIFELHFLYHKNCIAILEKAAGIEVVIRIITDNEFNRSIGNLLDPSTPLDNLVKEDEVLAKQQQQKLIILQRASISLKDNYTDY